MRLSFVPALSPDGSTTSIYTSTTTTRIRYGSPDAMLDKYRAIVYAASLLQMAIPASPPRGTAEAGSQPRRLPENSTLAGKKNRCAGTMPSMPLVRTGESALPMRLLVQLATARHVKRYLSNTSSTSLSGEGANLLNLRRRRPCCMDQPDGRDDPQASWPQMQGVT